MDDPEDAMIHQLRTRHAAIELRLKALAADARSMGDRASETRREFGNPFYYSGKTDKTDQLIDRYTGYKAHERGLDVVLEFLRLLRERRILRVELLRAGVTLEH